MTKSVASIISISRLTTADVGKQLATIILLFGVCLFLILVGRFVSVKQTWSFVLNKNIVTLVH